MANEYDEIDLGEWYGGAMTVEQMTFNETLYTLTVPKDIRNGDHLILVGTLVDDEVVELTLWVEPREEDIRLFTQGS